jgi:hypothetical protein
MSANRTLLWHFTFDCEIGQKNPAARLYPATDHERSNPLRTSAYLLRVGDSRNSAKFQCSAVWNELSAAKNYTVVMKVPSGAT